MPVAVLVAMLGKYLTYATSQWYISETILITALATLAMETLSKLCYDSLATLV